MPGLTKSDVPKGTEVWTELAPERRSKILLAESEDALAEQVLARLQEHFLVERCSNETDALNRLVNASFDMVIWDVTLPATSGLAIFKLLRDKGTPVLAIADKVDTKPCFGDFADDYINKPVSLDELSARVRALLRRMSNPD